jgi:short-subunit dehydrogenase
MTHTLITGASEGLGRAFAHIAAREGHRLVVSARNEARLQDLAAELKGADVSIIPADLSRDGEAERLWDEATRGRDVRVLVNNAGLGRNGAFADPDGWPREGASVMVNVVAATVLMKRAAVEFRQKGGGRILNVASIAGFLPGPNMAVYHATKAYLLSLSEAVATELAGSGVTVTALCPGATATEFFRSDGAENASRLARGRMASAETVAEAGWWGMKEGERVVIPGAGNKAAAFVPRVLPRGLAAALMGRLSARR